jgi:hypothetical protein
LDSNLRDGIDMHGDVQYFMSSLVLWERNEMYLTGISQTFLEVSHRNELFGSDSSLEPFKIV